MRCYDVDGLSSYCRGMRTPAHPQGRCTGYRPIYKAMRSVSPSDSPAVESTAPTKPRSPSVAVGPSGEIWVSPVDLAGTFAALAAVPDGESARLTVGNTSIGVTKYYVPVSTDNPRVFIDIAGVKELLTVAVGASGPSGEVGVVFGAAVTLSTVIDTCDRINSTSSAGEFPHIAAIARHLRLVAHPQVRQVASWCGNVMLAKSHPDFPSDVVLCLSATNAKITVSTPTGKCVIARVSNDLCV